MNRIAEVEGDGVTIWPNIWSLFAGCGANYFEGIGMLRWLAGGWKMVWRVCKNK